jgi:hypothetical protein
MNPALLASHQDHQDRNPIDADDDDIHNSDVHSPTVLAVVAQNPKL